MPAIGRSGGGSTRATLNPSLDPNRLRKTACAMLNICPSQSVDLRLDQPRVLPFGSHGLALESAFRHVCRIVDSMINQPQALSHLGLDDVLYRNIAMMLRPDLFVTGANSKTDYMRVSHARHRLDPLCDYIQAHLDERLTISDMERTSGMSARTLQYAFQQRFACTPMAWVRRERLSIAHGLLCNPDCNITVTKAALGAGFASQSLFARAYRGQFGELPSATRLRKLNNHYNPLQPIYSKRK